QRDSRAHQQRMVADVPARIRSASPPYHRCRQPARRGAGRTARRASRDEGSGLTVIIDCHAHLVAPDSLYAYRSTLLASAGHLDLRYQVDEAALATSAANNVAIMNGVGTDIQLISPRPYQQMHSVKPAKVVRAWIAANNDTIAKTVALHPERFMGVAG